ncbi:helix-turn-helix domain-containing protein [Streptomyces sp. A30]|uniref:helix-turn-helix domain-containing protein n=1 Tax=Streptomyces sp. A30 TaxID=2789273 RepID=UPI00397F5D65
MGAWMAGGGKRGRKPAAIRAETPQARALAEFLRELREKSGKTYDDLAKELSWSRSSIGNHLSGTVPTMDVVLKLVEATAPAGQLDAMKTRALRLWERATNPPAGDLAVRRPPQGAAPAAARFIAEGRGRLSQADAHSHRLAQDLATAQELVVLLTTLNAQLRVQIEQLAAVSPESENADQAQEKLTRAIEQLKQTEQDLTEARQARNEAEKLAATARHRCLELEEELALLRLVGPDKEEAAAPQPEEHAPDLDQTAFLADPAQALRTARILLDQGHALRTEVAGQMGLAATTAATDITVRRSERWHAATTLLGRTLGCLIAAAGASLHLVALAAHAPGWFLITDTVALSGLVLVAEPWHLIARLWPWLRAAARREPLPRPLPITYATLAPRALRCLTAALTAAGAAASLQAGISWGPWWWLLTAPWTMLFFSITVVGYDPALRRTTRAALADLAADLRAPNLSPNHSAELAKKQPWMRVMDAQWIDRRADELHTVLSGKWREAPAWMWICLTPIVLPGLYGIGVGLAQAIGALDLGHHAHLAVRTVDEPVTRFLHAHTAGLPLTPEAAHALWIGLGILALVLSTVVRAFAARLTWMLWGVGTVAMTWFGTGPAARGTAAGLVAVIWGLVSIIALNGVGQRLRITTINLFGDVRAAMQPEKDTEEASAGETTTRE